MAPMKTLVQRRTRIADLGRHPSRTGRTSGAGSAVLRRGRPPTTGTHVGHHVHTHSRAAEWLDQRLRDQADGQPHHFHQPRAGSHVVGHGRGRASALPPGGGSDLGESGGRTECPGQKTPSRHFSAAEPKPDQVEDGTSSKRQWIAMCGRAVPTVTTAAGIRAVRGAPLRPGCRGAIPGNSFWRHARCRGFTPTLVGRSG